ncbi:MAG: hypothetical protein JO284_01315 [Planctomycetaceae bacterium]|nr:hypothetical protein [Planctomycetaceae bacterium]MBV8231975.1 hypothetical protein [Planctomycetaceae bacterium]MBV8606528.1 hypothetical protein [Singulisphaera sp.]
MDLLNAIPSYESDRRLGAPPFFQESYLEMARGFLDEMLPRGEGRP